MCSRELQVRAAIEASIAQLLFSVEEGVWQLLKLKTPTFTEILFRGDSEEEAEPAEQKQDAPPIQLGS
jgi:hypothetical protein